MNNFITFLDARCERLVCEDCRNQAEEYATLLQNRTYALAGANDQLQRKEMELAQTRRELEMWKEIAQMPFNEIIQKWMEDRTEAAMSEGREQARAKYAELDKMLANIEQIIKQSKGREMEAGK